VRNHRVFIDENDPHYRFALEHLIRGWGYEVASVSRGLQAWRRLLRDASPRAARLDRGQGGIQDRRSAAKEMLHHQAQRDRLTGLWNREGILQVLRHEAAKARRTHRPVGLVILDLDNFRLVNHLFGSSAGDDLLQGVGQAMTKALRPYDSVGRCYADAFLAVLPACNLEATTLLAQRIQEHLPRAVGTKPEETFPLRATLAVATRSMEQGQDEECFLVEARRALSRAKKAGGNRIVAVEPVPSVPSKQGNASVPEADQGMKPLLFDEDVEQ